MLKFIRGCSCFRGGHDQFNSYLKKGGRVMPGRDTLPHSPRSRRGCSPILLRWELMNLMNGGISPSSPTLPRGLIPIATVFSEGSVSSCRLEAPICWEVLAFMRNTRGCYPRIPRVLLRRRPPGSCCFWQALLRRRARTFVNLAVHQVTAALAARDNGGHRHRLS